MRLLTILTALVVFIASCKSSSNSGSDFKHQPPDSCFTIIRHLMNASIFDKSLPESVAFKYVADVEANVSDTAKDGTVTIRKRWIRDSAYKLLFIRDSVVTNPKDSTKTTIKDTSWQWIPKYDQNGNKIVRFDENVRLKL